MRKLSPVTVAIAAAILWLAFYGGKIPGCQSIGGTPSPIPDFGLRVLMTYSDEGRDDLPPGQKRILQSTKLRDWLDAHCVKNAQGNPEWRVVPDATAFKSDQPIWQKLMAIKRDKSEWLVVADGKHGHSGPWPADEPALMTILEPFGGGK